MRLTFKDTLTRKESFVPTSGQSPVEMYVCGPTVYASSHVGHARTYLLFDIVKRFLRAQGGKVHHVQNITDFEDKITNRAAVEGISWEALSRRETANFRNAMKDLSIIEPDHVPLSSHYVRKMTGLVRTLQKRGFTYTRKGSIYFDTSAVTGTRNFPADDFLSAHALPEPGMKARPEANDPRDFLLWKPSKRPDPAWDSPWGVGQPGWHIECYAMASKHLTLPMDLHGGGLDLIFPHHYAENLISLALNGDIISRNFVHQAFVTMDARKMAKSTGNLVTIRDALKEVSPGGLRTYLLCKGYEERLEFSLYEARQIDRDWNEDADTLKGLLSAGGGSGYPAERLSARLSQMVHALGNNIGMREAMLNLHDLADDIRRSGYTSVARGDRSKSRQMLGVCEDLLGVSILGERHLPGTVSEVSG